MFNYEKYVLPTDNIDLPKLLGDWTWLVKKPYKLVLITAFGDLFLRDEQGQIDFLNANMGKITEVAASDSEFHRLLQESSEIHDLFLPGLVDELRSMGVHPEQFECYSFIHPPVLGGEWEAQNVEPAHIGVHHSIMGQIHEQTKDLPSGTQITEIRFADDEEEETNAAH